MSSLNSRNPTKKVWGKFRKVNGNNKPRTIPPLGRRKNIITSSDEITDTFADHYSNISTDPHKKKKARENGKKTK